MLLKYTKEVGCYSVNGNQLAQDRIRGAGCCEHEQNDRICQPDMQLESFQRITRNIEL